MEHHMDANRNLKGRFGAMKQISLRFGLCILLAALAVPALTGCSSDSMSSQITLTTSRSSIPADGNTTAEITATILGYDGEPVPIGTSMHFTTSRGLFTTGLSYLTVGTTDTTGTVRVYLMAPLRTTPGAANVTCQSNDVTRSINVDITLSGPPGETARIELTADPTEIPADGTPSTITATLTDGNEDPVNIGTSATFRTDRGIFQNGSTVFTDVTRDVSGTIIAYLTAPDGTESGPANITCTSNGVTAQVTVYVGGTGVSLVLTAPASVAEGADFNHHRHGHRLQRRSGDPRDASPILGPVGRILQRRIEYFCPDQTRPVKPTVDWTAQCDPGVYRIRASSGNASAQISIQVPTLMSSGMAGGS